MQLRLVIINYDFKALHIKKKGNLIKKQCIEMPRNVLCLFGRKGKTNFFTGKKTKKQKKNTLNRKRVELIELIAENIM